MNTKRLDYIIIFSLIILLIFANLFLTNGLSAKAETNDVYFGSVQPYAENLGSETIYYTHREEQYIETVNGVPLYIQLSNLENSCGATAGSIIVGFYDKYYEDLIPNYTSYFPATGKYRANDKVYVPALMEEFYSLMRTNVDDVGVAESDCLNGMRKYVQNKNHSFSYTSLKSSSKLNETAYVNSINSNKPVLLFNGRTELITDILTYSDHDSLPLATIAGNHIYVGYGYYIVKYYNGNNNFRTDTYLRVACGLSYTNAFIRIASNVSSISSEWFINAYSIAIS